MNNTTRLLDRWKKAHGIESDYEAAKVLGVSRNAVSQWRNRPSEAQAGVVIRMALDLHEDPTPILVAIAKGSRVTAPVQTTAVSSANGRSLPPSGRRLRA